MKLIGYLCLLSLFISLPVGSYERSDAFIVKIFDKRFRVLAPLKFDPNLHIIIENKTLTKTVAKLERANGKLIEFISVEPKEFVSVDLKIRKGEVLYLIPISPPFQKVELIPGRRPYEIPPKR